MHMNFKRTSSPRNNPAARARAPHVRLLLLCLLALAFAPRCLAQGSDDYHRVEVYGGYSLGRFKSNVENFSFASQSAGSGSFTDLCSAATGEMLGPNSQQFFCKRRNFNGFDASVTYNLSRYFGLKGDLTGHFRRETFVDDFGGVTQTISVNEHLYNFLGGVQLKDNRAEGRRLKPFAHALAGAARYSDIQGQTVSAFPQFNYVAQDRVTSFALKLGGGIDLRAGRRIDIRAVEFDYNPVFARARDFQTLSGPFTFHAAGKTAQNFTVGFGVVIH
jgi:hypothetical protein